MEITNIFLTPNKYSRPQTKLNKIKGVVIHYTASPNGTALGVRNYFEGLKVGVSVNGKYRYASTQYIVGLKGEVLRVIPDDEMAYHVGANTYKEVITSKLSAYPNNCTLGIEACHIDSKGIMTNATYNSLVELSVKLLTENDLTSADLYLHYDITGKPCHKWFVDNPKEWIKFKEIVRNKMTKKEVKRLTCKELIESTPTITDPEKWLRGINAVIELAKQNSDIGDLEIMQYLPTLIEKIGNDRN